MTREHNGHAESSPFSHWLRGLPEPYTSRTYSNQNLDYIWHNYRDHWLITLEEKRYGGGSSFAQRDTHGILSQLLIAGSRSQVKTGRGVLVRVEYRGHYVIQFENTTPDDGWVRVNGLSATRGELLALLLTGRSAIDSERQAA